MSYAYFPALIFSWILQSPESSRVQKAGLLTAGLSTGKSEISCLVLRLEPVFGCFPKPARACGHKGDGFIVTARVCAKHRPRKGRKGPKHLPVSQPHLFFFLSVWLFFSPSLEYFFFFLILRQMVENSTCLHFMYFLCKQYTHRPWLRLQTAGYG